MVSYFTEEKDYKTSHLERIRSNWRSGEEGSILSQDGVLLRYRKFIRSNSKATIVIIPGTSETMIKYQEFIFDIGRYGYSFYILDIRGHGLSGRITSDPQIVHVDRFSDYVEDLTQFYNDVIASQVSEPLILFGHSLGAAISAVWLAKNPGFFYKAVLSAPMFEVKISGLPRWFALLVLYFLIKLGKGDQYAPTQGAPKGCRIISESGTNSEARFKEYLKNIQTDSDSLLQGGVSNSWLYEAIRISYGIENIARSIKIPTLLLQAGKDDFVEKKAQDRYVEYADFCEKVAFEEGCHECWNDVDEVRLKAMNQIVSFIEK